jgi:hypothetical protein
MPMTIGTPPRSSIKFSIPYLSFSRVHRNSRAELVLSLRATSATRVARGYLYFGQWHHFSSMFKDLRCDLSSPLMQCDRTWHSLLKSEWRAKTCLTLKSLCQEAIYSWGSLLTGNFPEIPYKRLTAFQSYTQTKSLFSM